VVEPISQLSHMTALSPTEAAARVNRLSQAPFFQPFSPGDLAALAELLEERSFPSGAKLFEQGGPTTGLYLLLEGKVRVLRAVAPGRNVVIALAGQDSTLGELSILDGASAVKTAVAETEIRAFVISTPNILRFLRDHPLAGTLFAQACCKRFRVMLEAIDLQRQGTIRERLAKVLLDRVQQSVSDSPTHEDLANELGTAREVVTRTLHRMDDEGLIKVNRRRIELSDTKLLAQLASQVPVMTW
jgi:CRP-like cAMP-binding protein